MDSQISSLRGFWALIVTQFQGTFSDNALKQLAGDAIRAGHVVCIFAEGGITRTGEFLVFQRGFERIMRNVDAPIVPVALVGAWGSIFSFEGGRFFWKWPRKFPYPVTVRFGRPLPPGATPDETREAVDELINRR
jgi:acyl-[acyl-carrier-protein]-phospholipid O-acyltransferase/long-chain-fatty-acid--[acyl-carrier-protein] ligase